MRTIILNETFEEIDSILRLQISSLSNNQLLPKGMTLYRTMLLSLHFVLLLPTFLGAYSGTKNDDISNSLAETAIRQADVHDMSFFHCNPDEISFNIVLHSKKDEASAKNEVINTHDMNTSTLDEDESADVDRNKKQIERRFTINNLVEHTGMKAVRKVFSRSLKSTKTVHNEAEQPSSINNRTSPEVICLENIKLRLWEEYSYQKEASKTSQPTCQSSNADKAMISDLVNICTDALRYEDDENTQKEETLRKIKEDMEDLLLFSLYLDDSIHVISDIYYNIQNEISEYYRCCVLHTNGTKVKQKMNKLLFVPLCHTMELLDELVNALCDEYMHGLITKLSNLSEQYSNKPDELNNYVNSVISDLFSFLFTTCRYLRKNFYEVLKRSRTILISISSKTDKQNRLNLTNAVQNSACDNVINFEKPGSSFDTAESGNASKLLNQLKKSLIRTKRVVGKKDDDLTVKLVSELDYVVSWIEESLKCGFHDMTNLTRWTRIN